MAGEIGRNRHLKLASYVTSLGQPRRVGAPIEAAGRSYLADVTAAYSSYLQTRSDGNIVPGLAESRVPSDMRALLEATHGDLSAVAAALEHVDTLLRTGRDARELQQDGLLHHVDDVRFLPTVPRPGKVICSGPNYRSHATELSNAGVMERPERPVGFAKFPSALAGHQEDIVYPEGTAQLDYEGELAIVIGRTCKNVGRRDYLDCVAGFTIFNDLSLRDIQFREMRSGMLLLGKNLDGCGPLGPFLVTADEIGDPHGRRITTTVNQEIRQDASTGDFIFDCGQLVEYWSRLTLEPGDVIATGTPSGVGIFRLPPESYLLHPGDVIEVTIGGLGVLRNRIVESARSK